LIVSSVNYEYLVNESGNWVYIIQFHVLQITPGFLFNGVSDSEL